MLLTENVMDEETKKIITDWFQVIYKEGMNSLEKWENNDYFNKQYYQNHVVAHTMGFLMLRWAYNSWAADPQYDSRFGKWIGGDTYLVYPFNRSSVRFEKLIDGIEVAEKVRQLRREGVDVSEVEAVLQKIRDTDITDYNLPWDKIISDARKALDEVSRK